MAPFIVAFVALLWWEQYRRQFASSIPATAPRLSLAVASIAAAAGRPLSSAVEAAFYSRWWRARRASLAFGPLFVLLFQLSLLDLAALALGDIARNGPSWLPPALAPLAGLSLLKERFPGPGAGFWAGPGSLGLLTLARIGMTAWYQHRGADVSFGRTLRLTFAVWAITRIITWWLIDLARGMSPVS
jgi:hypothetical protein